MGDKGTILKITGVETKLAALGPRNCVFVQLQTDEGIVGIGETLYKRKARMVEAGIRELSRYLIGQDATRIEDHFEKMYRDAFLVGGGLQTAPISAVEMAMWDLLGKQLDCPVYKLLGGPTRDQIPVYCHCLSGDQPRAFAENARAAVDRGYGALKTTLPLFYGADQTGYVDGKSEGANAGYSGTRGVIGRSHKETEILPPRTLRDISDFFRAVRDEVGPEVQIMLDCHGRLNSANAIRLCELLADLDLLFVEEPVPPENVEALQLVASRSPIPIATGERWSTIYDAQRFLRAPMAIAQPDVVWCGGIAQMKKIAALAEASYVSVAPHNPNGPVATLASMHLAASIPNFLILETIGSRQIRDMEGQVADPLPELKDGCFALPRGPGLGIKLDWEACDQFPYRPFDGWR